MQQSTIACKLISPELQKRKSTMIAALQKQILEKRELADGYTLKFSGRDSIIDQVTDFVKSETHCCEFFTFTTKNSDEKSLIWLNITGQSGTKDFIEKELGF